MMKRRALKLININKSMSLTKHSYITTTTEEFFITPEIRAFFNRLNLKFSDENMIERILTHKSQRIDLNQERLQLLGISLLFYQDRGEFDQSLCFGTLSFEISQNTRFLLKRNVENTF